MKTSVDMSSLEWSYLNCNHQPNPRSIVMGSYHSDYDLHLSDSLLATTHQKVSKKTVQCNETAVSAEKTRGSPKFRNGKAVTDFQKVELSSAVTFAHTKFHPHLVGIDRWTLQNRLCKDDMLELPWRCWRLTIGEKVWGPTDGYDSSCRGCIPIRFKHLLFKL